VKRVPASRSACAIAALLALACHAQAQQFHRLTSAVVLPGEKPEWDYLALDAARNRLFIARRGAGAVVYDTNAQTVVGVIA